MHYRRGTQKVAGGAWHIQYYALELDPVTGKAGAKRVREYCTLPKSKAQRLLNERRGKIGRGEPIAIGRPVTVAELYDALRTFTENNTASKPAVAGLGWRWEHLSPFFGGMRAANVSTAAVEKYKQQRQAENAAPATVNRELAALRRAFNYGKRSTPPRVFAVPRSGLLSGQSSRHCVLLFELHPSTPR